MERPDDRELVDRYAGGDPRAFDEIVERYERRVYAVALRMTGNPDDARDAVQETFISALRALRAFRGDAQLSTWIHRVAINASLDVIRKRTRHGARPLEDAPDRPSDDLPPDEAAARASRATEVHRALAHVSVEHRAVLVLHDLQDLDYAEIAEALDIPVGTVKSRLHRARLEMARLLGHLRETEPEAPSQPLKDGR
ncbi:MAG: RNA polymerase sigma factor [Actinomycetota bacterium]